jgi:hypothetical protein
LIWWLVPTTIFGAIFPLAYQNYQPEVPDFSGYQLPTLALSLLAIWAIVARLNQQDKSASRAWVFCLIVTISIALSSPSPWGRSRYEHHLPRTIAQHWLQSLPANALLLVESDHWVFPLMYVQQIDKIRPDVVVFNTGFARSSWYWMWQKRLHSDFPALTDLNPKQTRQPRLVTLARAYQSVHTESAQLAELLSHPQSASPMISRACASGWGLNVRCLKPASTPSTTELKQWANLAAHQDQITRRVLARLGLDLTAHLWRDQEPQRALRLGYAALGEHPPNHLRGQHVKWWPAPPMLWRAARQGLIGDPIILRATLKGLAGIGSD